MYFIIHTPCIRAYEYDIFIMGGNTTERSAGFSLLFLTKFISIYILKREKRLNEQTS